MTFSSDSATVEAGAQMNLHPTALGKVQRRTATLRHPRSEMMANLVHEVGRATYTDPTTARLVVADFRAIPSSTSAKLTKPQPVSL